MLEKKEASKMIPRFHIPVMGWKVISLLEIINIGGKAYWSWGLVLRSLYLDPETGIGRCLEGVGHSSLELRISWQFFGGLSVVRSRVWSSQQSLWLWELDCKEGRCLWTVVLEKPPKSPLDSKEINPVTLKRDKPWMFTGRTDAKALSSSILVIWC